MWYNFIQVLKTETWKDIFDHFGVSLLSWYLLFHQRNINFLYNHLLIICFDTPCACRERIMERLWLKLLARFVLWSFKLPLFSPSPFKLKSPFLTQTPSDWNSVQMYQDEPWTAVQDYLFMWFVCFCIGSGFFVLFIIDLIN